MNIAVTADRTPLKHLAPRPRAVGDTGLSPALLSDLLCKHLRQIGTSDLDGLSRRLRLSGSVLEGILASLRADGHVEVHGAGLEGGGLRYGLTDRGRARALEAQARSGYLGPAPVPLALYEDVTTRQSVHETVVNRQAIRDAFAGVVIGGRVLDQLGPALHSGRAIFVYGSAGTGKTYICRRLARLVSGHVLVPYAIAISETIVEVFDPTVHRPAEPAPRSKSLLFEDGHDERFALCARPIVTVGGELTSDLLDVQHDASSGLFNAPLQLRANNGLLLLDDLGRQRASPAEVLNRWIVPLEERRDYLNLAGRLHFSVPFDLVLVFSTNLNPTQLADQAFLRRIGYKIRFDPLEPAAYRELWRQVCDSLGIDCPDDALDYLLDELHRPKGVELLPCHPRDLAGLVMDHCLYEGRKGVLDREALDWAWNNYFVDLA